MRAVCGELRKQAAVVAFSVISFFIPLPVFASIPLPSSPSWTSNDHDYSTGGALADVNGDGWLDFLMSNGNDMAMDFNSVYMNSAGTMESIASWRSSDNGYFGHCYAGDVNNDGLPDLAVAYLGSGASGEKTVRIYRNESGALGAAPWWKAHDKHSSFDCCLGDVDLDGDLDLAISAGDAYQNEVDSVRIYRNNGGSFDTLPFWTAHEGHCSDAVRFCDIDNDGDLDLFVGQVVQDSNKGMVSMYRNNGGVLETSPAWVARPGVGWVLRLAFADYDNDAYLDLAVASNAQTGEPNSIKVFHNNGGTLDTIASFTMLRANQYSSCVAWADVNGDNFPDLAAGGWWERAVVFENHAGVLDTTPTWSWLDPDSSLVCEAVVWGDITNGNLSSVNEAYDGDGQRKLFNLHRRPLQSLDSVYVNGARVSTAGFCFDLLGGWASFASAPPAGSGNVVFFYRYSMAPDLAVTNWNQSHGNYLFLNTTLDGVAAPREQVATTRLSAWPNPFRTAIRLLVAARGSSDVRIVDVSGREVRVLRAPRPPTPVPYSLSWDGRDETGRPVAPGVYFAAFEEGSPSIKLVRTPSN
jgi:hypothetical protein